MKLFDQRLQSIYRPFELLPSYTNLISYFKLSIELVVSNNKKHNKK